MNRSFKFILILAALLLSLCQAWQLWEQDIFWQVRSGAEMLHGQGFPLVDHWSFSAGGEPWMNLQWLSTILLYAVQVIGGFAGLVLCRVFISFLIFWSAGRLVISATREAFSDRGDFLRVLLCVLPLIAFAMGFRLQIRSEIFVILLYAVLLQIWWSDIERLHATWWSFALTVLSAQLHPGVAPFLVVTSVCFLWSSEVRRGLRWGWSIALCLAPFLAPYHLRLAQILIEHLFYYQATSIENPDHQAIGFEHFSFAVYGWTGVAWLVVTAIGLLQLWRSERTVRARWPVLALGVLLAVGSVVRDRVVPFEILFFAPYAARWFVSLSSLYGVEFFLRGTRGISVLFWLVMFPVLLLFPPMPLGLTLNRDVFPVGTVEFMKRENIPGEIFHLPAEGDYLLGAWPERKDFIDTREMPFRRTVQGELADVWSSGRTARYRGLFDRYGIKALLLPSHAIVRMPSGAFLDRVKVLFPENEWALVAFDRQDMVLVRRDSMSADWVAKNEFKLLKPHLPPDYYLHAPEFHRTPESDRVFAGEIARCLSIEPTQPICLEARDAFAAVARK